MMLRGEIILGRMPSRKKKGSKFNTFAAGNFVIIYIDISFYP